MTPRPKYRYHTPCPDYVLNQEHELKIDRAVMFADVDSAS